jgi:PHD/YefM family antitoxin component YafN of YafNO toxin-antitoxin module
MAISASDARKNLFPLTEQVNDDQEPAQPLRSMITPPRN